VAVTAVVLAVILFWVVLTTWVTALWCFGLAETGVLALGAGWGIRLSVRPCSVQTSPILIPLAGTVVIGLVQLATAHTANRWETWNAVLRWAVYLTAFFLASQIGATEEVLRPFRRALLYFGFVLSFVAVLQFFTSQGKIFWLFDSGYLDNVTGPFVSRDRYGGFIELIVPIALFEALSDRRRGLLSAIMAGAMVASVFASASRGASILVILEAAAVLLLAPRRGVGSAGGVSGMFAAMVVVCIVACTSVVGWTHLWERLKDPDPYGARREILISTIAMARAKPWTGFGLGSFETIYPGFAVRDIGTAAVHAHNDWAEWVTDGGIPLLACLLAVAVLSAKRLLVSVWPLGVLAVWLHGFVDFPMQTPALALWIFVILGGACAGPRNPRQNPRSPR